MNESIAILGYGAHTALGNDASTTFERMLEGASGIRSICRFDTRALPAKVAAQLDVDGAWSSAQRSKRILRNVVAEAWTSSRIPADMRRHAHLFLAAPTPDNDWAALRGQRGDSLTSRELHFDDEWTTGYGNVAAVLSDSVAPPIIVNTACASGASVIEMAVEAIRYGTCELAVVAGGDASLFEECVAKFCLLGALSTNAHPGEACRPFSADRGGFVMGEGGAALVLASSDFVRANGLWARAYVAGVGNATDNFHRTRSTPDGRAMIKSMRIALADAKVAPEMISHINAHGTGTPENDKMESLGIRGVFGDAASNIPLTANKSSLGHTLTAAGLIEAVISTMTIERQVIPPTLNYETPDETLGVRVIAQSQEFKVASILSNSFGFGGQNVSLVFTALPAQSERQDG